MKRFAQILSVTTVFLTTTSFLEAAYGDLVWEVTTDDIIYSSPAIGPHGQVVFGSEDGSLYAYHPNGTIKWVFSGASDWIDCSPAIAPDGTVYAGSWDNFLYAIDGETGSLKWTFETGGIILASPAVGSDGTVYLASNDSFLYAINPDGSQRWISEPVDSFTPINSSPVLNHEGTAVYFGNDDGQFFSVNAETGLENWSFDLKVIHPPATDEDYAILGSPGIAVDGNLYFGSENGYLYALDAFGNLRWTYKAPEAIRSSPAISLDHRVYFVSQDGYLYALDSEGFQLWETYVGDVFYCSPALDGDGNIIIAAYAGSLDFGAATDFLSVSSTGQIIWEHLIAGYNDSSPNIAPDGSIYVGAHDGSLYKFEGGAALMEGQWPRFLSNRRQTALPRDNKITELIDLFPAISMSSGGWAEVPWFGAGWVAEDGLPWIQHSELGRLYIADSHVEDVLFFDSLLSEWLYTHQVAGNFLYSYNSQSWLMHVPGTAAPGNRWFFDFDDLSWFSDH